MTRAGGLAAVVVGVGEGGDVEIAQGDLGLQTRRPETIVVMAGGVDGRLIEPLAEGHDAVLVVSAAARLDDRLVEFLAEAMDAHADYGVVAPTLAAQERPQSVHGLGGAIGADALPCLRQRGGSVGRVMTRPPQAVEWVEPTVLLIRSDVVDACGLPPVEGSIRSSIEYSRRVQRAGWQLGVAPAAVAWRPATSDERLALEGYRFLMTADPTRAVRRFARLVARRAKVLARRLRGVRTTTNELSLGGLTREALRSRPRVRVHDSSFTPSASPEPAPRSVRTVAFYLPQFHPIPENDLWWGPGFTEWRNVVTARPRFPGHEQPRLPADLGFYDLRLPEARLAQAQLAAAHGVDAFCYYHYWFDGRRLLERPFAEVLASGEPDFPFLLCWANEHWTRRWDGSDAQVLMPQRYSEADDLDHIRSLIPAFADPRYVTVDGRPVFLVYRAGQLPEPQRTTERWREELVRNGLPEPLLCRVESFAEEKGDPTRLGFDAAVEFAPGGSNLGRRASGVRRGRGEATVLSYESLRDAAMNAPDPSFVRFPGVTPGWDNTARWGPRGRVFHGSTPELYGSWLEDALRRAPSVGRGDSFVFVNAWNEWGEGAHLEPCLRHGRAYLEATARAVAQFHSR